MLKVVSKIGQRDRHRHRKSLSKRRLQKAAQIPPHTTHDQWRRRWIPAHHTRSLARGTSRRREVDPRGSRPVWKVAGKTARQVFGRLAPLQGSIRTLLCPVTAMPRQRLLDAGQPLGEIGGVFAPLQIRSVRTTFSRLRSSHWRSVSCFGFVRLFQPLGEISGVSLRLRRYATKFRFICPSALPRSVGLAPLPSGKRSPTPSEPRKTAVQFPNRRFARDIVPVRNDDRPENYFPPKYFPPPTQCLITCVDRTFPAHPRHFWENKPAGYFWGGRRR